MPVLPRSDMLDFDGFIVRRGNGQGCLNARPPEMRQACLMKNPVSIRRDSARAAFAGSDPSSPRHQGDSSTNPKGTEDNAPVISFVYDAIRPGTLSLHLLVTEVESGTEGAKKGEDGKKEKKGKGGPSFIKLFPRDKKKDEEKPEDLAFLLDEDQPAHEKASLLEMCRVQSGLGQTYQSPPIDLQRWPASQLAYDPTRPKDIPIAVQLEADVQPGEQPSIQFTYISLQNGIADGDNAGEKRAQWSASIFAQKLQYGTQCFVLHEVFGVSSKLTLDTEVEGGNSDCVICLSEPRDTAVLPCRHMCFCSYCAGIVRLQCDRCPVCRQKVQSLLQFKRENDLVIDESSPGGVTKSMALADAQTTPADMGEFPVRMESAVNEEASDVDDAPASASATAASASASAA